MTKPVKRGTFRRTCRRCSWSGEATTSGRADHAKRRHNCDKHLAKAAATARDQARDAAIDRTPAPCFHKEVVHQHGTYTCYTNDKCRCRPCSKAAADYERSRVRRNAYGRSNLVDAEPARQHVRQLMAGGMGWKTVASKSELSPTVICQLLYGKPRPTERLRKRSAEQILAIQLELAPSAVVDGTDTARRLQGLVAMGYTQTLLADRLDSQLGNFGPLIRGERNVLAATAKAVHALYVELGNSEPPTATAQQRTTVLRMKRHAARKGWLPPVRVGGRVVAGSALPIRDDETSGYPPLSAESGSEFDEAAVMRFVNGERNLPLTTVDRVEIVRRWREQGRPLRELELLGWRPSRYLSQVA